MPEGRRPRGVTRRLTSGREAESARLRRHRNGREELPLFGGQEPAARRSPATEVRGGDERSYPASEVRAGCRKELPQAPKPEARGGSREEQPHVQGAEAVWAQEGLEELLGRVPYKTAAALFCFMAPVRVLVENAQ